MVINTLGAAALVDGLLAANKVPAGARVIYIGSEVSRSVWSFNPVNEGSSSFLLLLLKVRSIWRHGVQRGQHDASKRARAATQARTNARQLVKDSRGRTVL